MAEPDEQAQLSADEIRQLYHDPRVGLCCLKAFVQKVRGRATPAAIRKALDADETFALNVPRTRPRSLRPAIVRGDVDDTWACDLVVMDNVRAENDNYRNTPFVLEEQPDLITKEGTLRHSNRDQLKGKVTSICTPAHGGSVR